MAFVAAAQRAALSGVTWPTQGSDPQGRAQLSGVVTGEEAVADTTNAERLAGIQGFDYPSNINTELGRGVVSGVFVPDAGALDVVVDAFQTEWNLIVTSTLAGTSYDGVIGAEMARFGISLQAGALTELTIANIKKLAFYHRLNMRDVTGQSVNITNTVFRRAHAG